MEYKVNIFLKNLFLLFIILIGYISNGICQPEYIVDGSGKNQKKYKNIWYDINLGQEVVINVDSIMVKGIINYKDVDVDGLLSMVIEVDTGQIFLMKSIKANKDHMGHCQVAVSTNNKFPTKVQILEYYKMRNKGCECPDRRNGRVFNKCVCPVIKVGNKFILKGRYITSADLHEVVLIDLAPIEVPK